MIAFDETRHRAHLKLHRTLVEIYRALLLETEDNGTSADALPHGMIDFYRKRYVFWRLAHGQYRTQDYVEDPLRLISVRDLTGKLVRGLFKEHKDLEELERVALFAAAKVAPLHIKLDAPPRPKIAPMVALDDFEDDDDDGLDELLALLGDDDDDE